MNAVVIGVGNSFRQDDGAGPAVVDMLAALGDAIPADTRLTVCDGEPARMIDLWEDADLAIVIDAAAADPEAGHLPGDVLRWEVSVEAEADAPAGPDSAAATDAPADRDAPAGPGAPASPDGAAARDSATARGQPVGDARTAVPGRAARRDVDAPATPLPRPEAAGTHSLGPGTAISLARVLDRLPGRLLVFAIVGTDFHPGLGLSAPVAAAVPRLTREIVAELTAAC